MTERTKYIGAVEDQSDCDDGERVAQMRYAFDNRQTQLDELAQARADIASKDRMIELLQAQVSALKSLEMMARLFQIADELDAQESTP